MKISHFKIYTILIISTLIFTSNNTCFSEIKNFKISPYKVRLKGKTTELNKVFNDISCFFDKDNSSNKSKLIGINFSTNIRTVGRVKIFLESSYCPTWDASITLKNGERKTDPNKVAFIFGSAWSARKNIFAPITGSISKGRNSKYKNLTIYLPDFLSATSRSIIIKAIINSETSKITITKISLAPHTIDDSNSHHHHDSIAIEDHIHRSIKTSRLEENSKRKKILTIATDIDYEGYKLFGELANIKVVEFIELTKPRFRDAFGIELKIHKQNVHTSQENFNFTPNNSILFLKDFRNYSIESSHLANSNSILSEGYADLNIIFSAKEFTDAWGRAYLSSVCRYSNSSRYRFNFGFVKLFSNLNTFRKKRVLAHEIGHSLSARHIDSGDYIMSINTNSHLTKPLEFSQSSKEVISNFLNLANCLKDVAEPTPTVIPSNTPTIITTPLPTPAPTTIPTIVPTAIPTPSSKPGKNPFAKIELNSFNAFIRNNSRRIKIIVKVSSKEDLTDRCRVVLRSLDKTTEFASSKFVGKVHEAKFVSRPKVRGDSNYKINATLLCKNKFTKKGEIVSKNKTLTIPEIGRPPKGSANGENDATSWEDSFIANLKVIK